MFQRSIEENNGGCTDFLTIDSSIVAVSNNGDSTRSSTPKSIVVRVGKKSNIRAPESYVETDVLEKDMSFEEYIEKNSSRNSENSYTAGTCYAENDPLKNVENVILERGRSQDINILEHDAELIEYAEPRNPGIREASYIEDVENVSESMSKRIKIDRYWSITGSQNRRVRCENNDGIGNSATDAEKLVDSRSVVSATTLPETRPTLSVCFVNVNDITPNQNSGRRVPFYHMGSLVKRKAYSISDNGPDRISNPERRFKDLFEKVMPNFRNSVQNNSFTFRELQQNSNGNAYDNINPNRSSTNQVQCSTELYKESEQMQREDCESLSSDGTRCSNLNEERVSSSLHEEVVAKKSSTNNILLSMKVSVSLQRMSQQAVQSYLNPSSVSTNEVCNNSNSIEFLNPNDELQLLHDDGNSTTAAHAPRVSQQDRYDDSSRQEGETRVLRIPRKRPCYKPDPEAPVSQLHFINSSIDNYTHRYDRTYFPGKSLNCSNRGAIIKQLMHLDETMPPKKKPK